MPVTEVINKNEPGRQRLSVQRLDAWRELEYGMFIHYGLATFEQATKDRLPTPQQYAPTCLDVDQWVRVARDAGMKYIILTAQHILDGGFCLWHTDLTDFSVRHATETTDVVGAFVEACERHGIRPALYLGGDRYNVPDGLVRNPGMGQFFYATREYLNFLKAQIEELLTRYGRIEEVWIDGPAKFGVPGRTELCEQIGALQPDAVVVMNGSWEDNGREPRVKPQTWPSDILGIELGVPPIWGTGREDCSNWRALRWDPLGRPVEDPLPYYMPMEVVTLANTGPQGWHWGPEARARSSDELLAVRLLCKARNANCVFNVPPDRTGRIAYEYVQVLSDVQRRWEGLD